MSDISDQIRKTTSWETMEDYNKECEKRKVRARKFGTEYVAPKLEDFLPWTEVKRIHDAEKRGQDSTPKGFATGIDLTDAEEIAKQEARKARFTQQQSEDNPANDSNANGEGGADESKPAGKVPKPDLPVAQCWDKEEMLIGMRSDPPSKFWIKPTKEAITPEEKKDNDTTDEEMKEVATWVPEKIHLSSIDWAAFKQIRNKDLMAYFTGYGPTYVEWLGDVSCNVCFEDQFTAKRALMTLGQEIPSPPPSDVANYADTETKGDSESTARNLSDLGNMTWRFCRKPIRKVNIMDYCALRSSLCWFFFSHLFIYRLSMTSMAKKGQLHVF